MSDLYKEALILHRRLKGKLNMVPKMEVRSSYDLSLVYSPGVAEPCKKIADEPDLAYKYTIKGNTVAIVSDGSAVLGLGNIGPLAALPVMEGKAVLFKRFANINAFPICLQTQDVDEIVQTIRNIAPSFGGINLEDISAPRSFLIEQALQDLGIPVFHDDQHGTAIVVLAGLYNAAKVLGKSVKDLKVVINGAGAAGIAIARMLRCVEHVNDQACIPVREIVICDSKGIIHSQRSDLNFVKKELLSYTNHENQTGSVQDAIVGADVFIGVSIGGLLSSEDIARMNADAIVFALANPTPEIMPDEAYKGGASIVATGRSDLPNQVNNVLGFPGIFRGALEARAPKITMGMKLAAVHAIAEFIRNPTKEEIIPSTLNEGVAYKVAEAVKNQALLEF